MPNTRAETPRLGTDTRTGLADLGRLAGVVFGPDDSVALFDGAPVGVPVGVPVVGADGLTFGAGRDE
jgi:hypothetical protein